MTSGDIYYAEQEDAYVLKFVGDIRYTLGCALDDLTMQQLARDDLPHIFIDLREADSIDSTSLGLLAKVANTLRDQNKDKAVVISSNENINEVLESMGFDEIFSICTGVETYPAVCQHLSTDGTETKEHMTKIVLEAHSVLSELNDKNREMFSSVVGALKGKLASP